MKRIIALALILVSLFSNVALAETADYSFLDEMEIAELEALQNEVNKRINAAKKDSASANPSDLGMWTLKYFVDEFKMPTDEGYITNSQMIAGTFSNSATTNSTLKVKLLVDTDGDVQIFLYEYGRSQVKNYYSDKKKYYDVVMLDNDGIRHYLEGFFYSNADRLMFNDEDNKTIIRALSANGTVRFAIQDSKGSDSYVFAIEDTSYFTNAYTALLKK